ncbi:MAG TPA: HNH endonuclease signature motif containing protein [Pirellulales bacterium]
MEEALEQFIWYRANGCCEYCQVPQLFDPLQFQIDHIIAVQHSGRTVEDNLALACYTCNRHKGPNIAGFDHVTQQITPLYNPRRNIWDEDFQWQGPELIGLTPSGRVTVLVLAINRDFRVALRRALIHEGVFPPVTT